MDIEESTVGVKTEILEEDWIQSKEILCGNSSMYEKHYYTKQNTHKLISNRKGSDLSSISVVKTKKEKTSDNLDITDSVTNRTPP